MASGSFTGTTSNQYITPRIVWSSTANTTANTSSITVTFQVMKSSASSGATYGTGAWTIEINGQLYNFSETISIPANNSYVSVYTKTVNNIAHNSDGTKSFRISLTGGISGTTYTTTTIGQNVTLDVIPRASTISSFSFTNGDISQGFDINISSKNNAYYHDIHLYVPDTSGVGVNLISTTNGRVQGGSRHVNITVSNLQSLYNALSNKTSSTFTVYVRTYTNATSSTTIGDWQTASATGKIPDSVKPIITDLEATLNSNGLNGLCVQGKSTIKLTTTATPGSGSSIVSYTYSGPNLTSVNASTMNTNVVWQSGTLTYKVIVQDSRGRTAERTNTIYVYPYSVPTIGSVSVQRCLANGTLSQTGTYVSYNISSSYSPVNNNNTRTITAAYSSNNGSTYSSATTIQAASNTSNTVAGVYGGGAFNASSSYAIKFTITDSYGATALTVVNIPTASRPINIKLDGNGIAFGKMSEGNGIETSWDMSIMGAGEKAILFKNASSSNWQTKIYKGSASSSTALGAWDDTNNRGIWRYTTDGGLYIDRPLGTLQGIIATPLPSGTNLNNIARSGFYKCATNADAATMSNVPIQKAFSLLVEEHAGIKQTFTVYENSGKPVIYVRNYYNGTWGSWSRASFDANYSILWSGSIRSGALTLNESFKNFSFLTCVLGDASTAWGITLGAFWDNSFNELHFGAVYTNNSGIAGDNLYGAKFSVQSNTSLGLTACGTKNGSGSYLKRIVGWR